MAGAYTHTETVAYANNSGQIQSLKNVMTGDAEFNVSTLVGANTAAQEIDVAFARAQLRSLCITSTGPVTIMTNSSTTPGDTKTLIAGQTLIWDTKHPEALPFTADVTKLFITTGALPSTVVMSFLTNLSSQDV